MRKTCQITRQPKAIDTAKQSVNAKTTEDRGLSCNRKIGLQAFSTKEQVLEKETIKV